MKAMILSLMMIAGLSAFACGAEEQQEQTPAAVSEYAPLTIVSLADGRTVLAGDNSLTIYVFDVDTTSDSTCYDACAAAWPPVLVPAGAQLGADMGITVRKDGSQQLTLEGRPIYFFAGDAKAGDIRGDGLGGVWHLVEEK
jgi:predicted lipoprotein with Yx(FWY)xxD motif